MPRKNEKVKELLPIILKMSEEGKTQRQIADGLGLDNKKVVNNLLYRTNCKNQKSIPKRRGRKPAKTLQEYKYENKRLKMGNALLRNFLLLIGKERKLL